MIADLAATALEASISRQWSRAIAEAQKSTTLWTAGLASEGAGGGADDAAPVGAQPAAVRARGADDPDDAEAAATASAADGADGARTG